MIRWFPFIALSLVAFAWSTEARIFQNSYVRFELPNNWNCGQEGPAWVCASTNALEAREAVIISTAKLSGPDDSLKSFDNYLRQPKTLISKAKSSLSQPISVNRRKVGGQDWVQSVHIGSEVPNFTTRYMATVKQKLAILVSFSADRESSEKYDAIFDRAIRSLQVDASKPVLIQSLENPNANPKAVIGQTLPTPGAPLQPESGASRQKKLWLFGLIALAAAGVLFAIRKLV